ncbi:acetate--CoA ligase (plasmid) [Haloferax mediterranei ATCC 33500]|uniref:Acetate--CoA ligase n=1 Tax=Haloferax mediterranei (strain ATCC 33500 / DSM 1411 / JCM 8866 / NBRC 14739 / NCIMB 2177 / R-4) TaxID=523841 RepID=I3R9Q5_HALMT|nr:acetate--CoA ligase [Haloferax mediterranei]AFK20965.1 acyl-CoA synthetase [Haloferax mediterranei ATCC 33500]AHZ24171.1 acetyl-CoA synthetase [Haloferax mediterranei ATCC 33500]EMA05248.1 acyl-CoA synthetase [Haloferax mediterranei ATCC 33500]MDX5989948.1 acetate--CoA ligase [Haloferax mediterranei ATCC 33500]QCQ77136.1 acetate--CoA ligase [Haloferax mediterranei ATCC 33500]
MADGDIELEARLEEQAEFEPSAEFVAQANVSDPSIYEEFEENWPECWERAADLLDWDGDYDEVLDDSNPPFYEWFTGGKLNASSNCVDRHVENGDKNRVAIKWEGELGETRTYTYQDLYREVNEFAAALRAQGVEEDDVVTLYMPMIPELPIAMLACARIGAPHSVVFAGFSAEALATRMNSADSRYLVTCDGYYRRGDALDHLDKANEGLDGVDHGVESVVVVDRLGDDGFGHDLKGNQHDWSALMDEHDGERVAPVERDAEDMLFLMYTSGTTGQPKGVKHTTGGYLSYAAWTSHAVLDIEPEDTYWCSADIGWITGHSYIVYGPLALGTTTVMYEGTPDYPTCDRLWETVEKYAVDIFYTAPTAIRAFMKWGKKFPESRDLSSLRLLGTVGEPINPRAWKWYHKYIGNEDCPIVDTWWQTETGGMMITTLPGIGTMKPGAAGPPLPGVDAQIVDTNGEEVQPGRAGYLTVNKPWPGMLRTLYKNDERYISEYWREYSDTDSDDPDDWVYFPEDGAKIDEDGYITILGRVDDVINVSGHRLGTMEIESAIVGVEGVAEAAVVGGDHEIKGEAVYAYVITEDGYEGDEDLRERIIEGVNDGIGPIARPEKVVFTPELPKTRSGKIMRRLLEDVANGDELGNTSTLRNPEIVEEIEAKVHAQSD